MSAADATLAKPKPVRKPLPWPWVAVFSLVTLFCYFGSQRVPAGGDFGTAFQRSDSTRVSDPSAAKRRFRLGTFNIHGGVGADDRFDLQRTAANLHTLDFAGLNEVHGASLLDPDDQAELLGRAIDRSWLFAPTEQRWFHYGFGNGAVSSLPVTSWQRIPLPRRHARSFRNLLLVTLDCQGTRVNVVVTHLDREPRERPEQLRAVSELFLSLAEPAVLMGDMNTPADDPDLKRLLAVPGVVDAVGQALGDKTPPHIDWILLRGLKCLDSGLTRDGASDHPLAWAEVELLD